MAEYQQGSENTEEDATELQFPKGVDDLWKAGVEKVERLNPMDEASVTCQNCESVLEERYLECVECWECEGVRLLLCARCFSQGSEFGTHASHHSYAVVRTDFSLFDPSWKAREELALLGAVGECGLGNWGEVSQRLPGRSAQQCRDHYLQHYVEDPPPPLAGLFQPEPVYASLPAPVEYLAGLDDPPRPLAGSTTSRELAGYNAARGDFAVEFEDGAEQLVQDIESGVGEGLETALILGLLDQYRRCLGRRHYRKHLLRQHGLVAPSKAMVSQSRYRPYLSQALARVLPKLHSLLSSQELDLLLEGFKCEFELKRYIAELKEYREQGLRRQASVATFLALRQQREVAQRDKRCLVVAQGQGQQITWQVLGSSTPVESASLCGGSRRISLPLNIVGKPGYDNLSQDEKQLASDLRLLPEDFLRFKKYFVDECHKQKGLRLAQARTLLKIDVNKTRKLYDFLLSVGLIYCPSKGP